MKNSNDTIWNRTSDLLIEVNIYGKELCVRLVIYKNYSDMCCCPTNSVSDYVSCELSLSPWP